MSRRPSFWVFLWNLSGGLLNSGVFLVNRDMISLGIATCNLTIASGLLIYWWNPSSPNQQSS